MIERISPPGAPTPRGPYSPAVRAGDYIYVAGQVPLDPVTGNVVSGDIQVETRQVLNNIKNILEGCGSSMAAVVRCGVYLIDAADFKAMNEVYAEFFGDARPARTTIIVAALPLKDAKVEIDAVAYTGK
ncbi:MAG TPA: Rid family detoxifying hydrolase [Bryobacteraceae bacterium]|nr:Rid family detoxifying hydrolase [Bryobacteraceae bacterium]